jgi:hypothetical protein
MQVHYREWRETARAKAREERGDTDWRLKDLSETEAATAK